MNGYNRREISANIRVIRAALKLRQSMIRINPTARLKMAAGIFAKGTLLSLLLSLPLALNLSCTPVSSYDSQAQIDARRRIAKSDEKYSTHIKFKRYKIGRLHIAVWKPRLTGANMAAWTDKISTDAISQAKNSIDRSSTAQTKIPLIIFSHGSGGINTQSKFIMESFARAGYLVIAPNHKDATLTGLSLRPDFTFPDAADWTDHTFEDRREDIVELIKSLHEDTGWNDQIDWSRLVLSGHSLGGYTVMGMAGAWPSWKIDGIKAVIGFSPYSEPFAIHGDLKALNVPIMYQGGTKDHGITPSIKKDGGVYSQTPAPACFVEFDHVGHLGWTNFDRDKVKQHLIDYYALYFIDRYVNNKADMPPLTKLDGVTDLEIK